MNWNEKKIRKEEKGWDGEERKLKIIFLDKRLKEKEREGKR